MRRFTLSTGGPDATLRRSDSDKPSMSFLFCGSHPSTMRTLSPALHHKSGVKPPHSKGGA